jgi:hypothetical protein
MNPDDVIAAMSIEIQELNGKIVTLRAQFISAIKAKDKEIEELKKPKLRAVDNAEHKS